MESEDIPSEKGTIEVSRRWVEDSGAALVEWVLIVAAVVALAGLVLVAVNNLVGNSVTEIENYDSPVSD